MDLVTAGRAPNRRRACQHYPRHVVLVLVDRLDLAVIRALRYAGSLRPTEMRAVHVVLDAEVAKQVQQRLDRARARATGAAGTGGVRRPAPGPGQRPGRPADRGAGAGRGHAAAAPADFPPGFTAHSARPDRRPDRRGDQPDPARGGHHRPVRHHAVTGGATPPGRPATRWPPTRRRWWRPRHRAGVRAARPPAPGGDIPIGSVRVEAAGHGRGPGEGGSGRHRRPASRSRPRSTTAPVGCGCCSSAGLPDPGHRARAAAAGQRPGR